MSVYLVTGGAGFIGSHLVEALLDEGRTVRVLDNFSSGHHANLEPWRDRIQVIDGDVTDPNTVREALRGVEVVFHEAALASVPRSLSRPLDTNHACVAGTVTLLDGARQSGVRRVVYAASSSAYGDQPQRKKTENLMPLPKSPYAAAKLAGEFYCQAFAASFGLETVCLRYFNVFGPRQDPNSEYSAVIPRFVTALLSGKPPTIYGDGQQSRDFTYVANVVRGNLLAAQAPGASGKVFNMACGTSFSLLYLLEKLGELLGVKPNPMFEPARAGDVRDSLADISTAQQVLGYTPVVTFEEGLRRSVDYYRSLTSKAGR